MPNVSVYVPKDLYDRSKKHDEINLSQVLQAALKQKMRELDKRGPDISNLVDVPALLERFSEERAQLYNAGVRVGVRYAKDITYADMLQYATYDWITDRVIKSILSSRIMRYTKGDEDICPMSTEDATDEWGKYEMNAVFSEVTLDVLPPCDDVDIFVLADKAKPEVYKGFVAGLRAVWDLIQEEEGE